MFRRLHARQFCSRLELQLVDNRRFTLFVGVHADSAGKTIIMSAYQVLPVIMRQVYICLECKRENYLMSQS